MVADHLVGGMNMSRSYKKNPWIKDYNKGSKTLANKKFRRITKQKIKVMHEDTILPEDLNETGNPYDISDYKFLVDEPEYGLKGKDNKLFK